MEQRRIALVLGGGGMKGFAHLGVLRALEEAGIRPTCFAGTSIGALIAAAYLGGMSLEEMERRALGLRKRDVFRINHVGMLFERMRSPSIYLEEPLRALCSNAVPPTTFDEPPGAAPREHGGRGARNAGRLGAAWAHERSRR